MILQLKSVFEKKKKKRVRIVSELATQALETVDNLFLQNQRSNKSAR
jgi:hypothetical protein